MSHIETWLNAYVNAGHFAAALEADIEALPKPAERVKARLELLSYIMPKVKGIDPLTPDQMLHTIQIKYVEARPKKEKAPA